MNNKKDLLGNILDNLDRGVLCPVHAARRSLLWMEYAIREPGRHDAHSLWLQDRRHGSTAWLPDAFRYHADDSITNHTSLLAQAHGEETLSATGDAKRKTSPFREVFLF